MRSGTSTKSRLPAEVVRDTKSRIAIFTVPSFQDGSGSFCPKAARVAAAIPTATTPRPNERRSIESPSACVDVSNSTHACTVCPMRKRMAGQSRRRHSAVALDDLWKPALESPPASQWERAMRRRILLLAFSMAAIALNAMPVSAQDKQPFKPEELDQMLAPIALYPDSLLSQIMMAASY